METENLIEVATFTYQSESQTAMILLKEYDLKS